MNYDCSENPEPCTHCVLMQLVPPGFRSDKTPCRHLPLNEQGETLDSLYRYDNQPEVEESVGNWLRTTIAKLEETPRVAHLDSSRHVAAPGGAEIQALRCFRSLTPSVQTRRVPRLFSGPVAANFSASGPVMVLKSRIVVRWVLGRTFTA